jgi:hypothetical protein
MTFGSGDAAMPDVHKFLLFCKKMSFPFSALRSCWALFFLTFPLICWRVNLEGYCADCTCATYHRYQEHLISIRYTAAVSDLTCSETHLLHSQEIYLVNWLRRIKACLQMISNHLICLLVSDLYVRTCLFKYVVCWNREYQIDMLWSHSEAATSMTMDSRD